MKKMENLITKIFPIKICMKYVPAAINPKSHVLTPNGIVFFDMNTIYILIKQKNKSD